MRTVATLLVMAATLSAFSCGGGGSEEGAPDQGGGNVENASAEIAPNATANAEPTVFCKVIERRVSKDDCDDLAAIEGQVKEGAGAFNVPDPMTRGKAVPVVLVIDRRSPEEVAALDAEANESNAVEVDENASTNLDEDQVENTAANETATANEMEASHRARHRNRSTASAPTPSQRVKPFEGRTETLIPKVGRYMSADLVGDGFDIKPMTPRSQEVPPNEQATWEWSVKPTVKGAHFLTLKTIVEGEVEGRRFPLGNTQTIKEVTVRVGPGDWLADAVDGTIAWLNRMKLLLLALAGVIGALWFLKGKIGGKTDDKDAND